MGKINVFYKHEKRSFEAIGHDGNTIQTLPLAFIDNYAPGVVDEHDFDTVLRFCKFLEREFEEAYRGIPLSKVRKESAAVNVSGKLDRRTGNINTVVRDNPFAELSLQNAFARHNAPVLEALGFFGPATAEEKSAARQIEESPETGAQRDFDARAFSPA